MAMILGRGHFVVIGGGIAGLAATNRLLAIAPDARVTLLEAESSLGGKIATERIDDFVIEAGPDSFLASKPRGFELCQEVGLGDRLQRVTPQPHRAFVRFRGKLHELPEGLSGLVPTRMTPLLQSDLLSPLGKTRVALDYLIPARGGDGDESLGGFMRRRLGREAWERLVEPLMAGIYAADGDDLSLAATFPQLRAAEREHGGLIRGVLAARGRASFETTARAGFLTPIGGLAELVVALDRRLRQGGVEMRLGTRVEAIEPTHDGYAVYLDRNARLVADAVVVATPAYESAALLQNLDPSLAADLRAIPHASTAIVSLAWRSGEIPHPLQGHGYVVPRVEGGSVLACTWSSRKWAGRAPEGWELLRVFIGRSGQDDMLTEDNETLVDLARAETGAYLGITAPPSLWRVRRWPRSMPQYLLGHRERVARIEAAAAEHPGVFLAGNALHGVGLPDCIVSGERAATAAAAHLATRATSLSAARSAP
jgi:oxygen-dependent protoporphyrinogen oxidase